MVRRRWRVAVPIADVIAADRVIVDRMAVIIGRAEADGDARQSRERLDDAHELRRAIDTIEIAKARREIGDANFSALVVGQFGDDDGRVAQVIGFDVGKTFEHDIGKALLLVAGEKARKYRIAVESRKAPPGNARARLDQSRRASVSNERKIKSVIRHCPSL